MNPHRTNNPALRALHIAEHRAFKPQTVDEDFFEVLDTLYNEVVREFMASIIDSSKDASTFLLTVGEIKPGDQIYLSGYTRWFAVEEVRDKAFKLFAVDDYPFTRYPIPITKNEYVIRRANAKQKKLS